MNFHLPTHVVKISIIIIAETKPFNITKPKPRDVPTPEKACDLMFLC